MRFLVRLCVGLAILWCGWWALASWGVARGIEGWVSARQADGWQAEVAAAQGGFPLNIAARFSTIDIANPATRQAVVAQGGAVRARTYWPGHLDIDLPDTPITLRGPTQETTFTTQNGQVKLRLRPGFALELGEVGLTTAPWTVAEQGTEVLRGQALALTAQQSAVGSARYDISLNASGLAIGATPRQMLSLPASLPETFDQFQAKGAVVFDAPLTRGSFEAEKPQFRQIILDGAQVTWGSIVLRAMGALDVDDQGRPTGTIDVQAKNWRNLLDLAQSAGILPHNQRGQVELIFTLMANRAGAPEDIDLAVEFTQGALAISGIPMGRSVRFIWR